MNTSLVTSRAPAQLIQAKNLLVIPSQITSQVCIKTAVQKISPASILSNLEVTRETGTQAHTDSTTYGSTVSQYGSQTGVASNYGPGSALPSYGFQTSMTSSYGAGESYTTGANASYSTGASYTLPPPVSTDIPSLVFGGTYYPKSDTP